ncbi:MAG: formate/nitrite transporter family protein [Gemmatimonadota bacterium]
MSTAPKPLEIFHRAAEEGQRRLDQSLLELAATSLIAGFTIVFGIAALGVVQAAMAPLPGQIAELGGALGFGLGLAYLVVGRTELFTENFFDPVATLFARHDRGLLSRIGRLWSITLVMNLAGGLILTLAVAVPGALPPEAGTTLAEVADHIAERAHGGIFMSAVMGGALIAILSYMLQAVEGMGTRAWLAYSVGFLLAIGPFDHVVVTLLHLAFGVLFGASLDAAAIATVAALDLAGNVVGGVGLVALSHVAQARGARESDDGDS